MEIPKTLADLENLLTQILPGARVTVHQDTGQVVIKTRRYLRNGDATNALVSKKERAADYEGEGSAYVIELARTDMGRTPGTYYYVEEAEDYTTDIEGAQRFGAREEAEAVIDDGGLDEDEPRVRVIR